MKNVFLALLLFVGITVLAQEKEMKKHNGDKYASLTSEQKIELQVKRMTKDLNLNEKQIKEMKNLVAKEVEKRENKKAELEAFKTQKRKEMIQDSITKSTEMKKILSSEQYAEWEKIQEEKKEKMKEKRHSKKLYAVPDDK